MDDELHQLEAELKRLRPAAPSGKLAARIEHALGSAAPMRKPRASIHWWWAAALPAAAAIAMVLTREPKSGNTGLRPALQDVAGGTPALPAAAITDTFKPVAAEKVLYSATDEGLVTLADGTPARRERLQYVDTITWKNPRTNASLTWSVPREEVRVVPVSFH